MSLKSEMLRMWIIYLFSSPRKFGRRCLHLFPISKASSFPALNTNVTIKTRLLSVHHLILRQELLIGGGHVKAPISQVLYLLVCEAALSRLNVIFEVKHNNFITAQIWETPKSTYRKKCGVYGKQALLSSCELLRQDGCQKLSLAFIYFDRLG